MPADPNMPVALMMEQLKATQGWRALEERLNVMVEGRLRTLTNMPGDASLAEIQRVLGQIEAFRIVLREPKRFEAEWQRARAHSPAHAPKTEAAAV